MVEKFRSYSTFTIGAKSWTLNARTIDESPAGQAIVDARIEEQPLVGFKVAKSAVSDDGGLAKLAENVAAQATGHGGVARIARILALAACGQAAAEARAEGTFKGRGDGIARRIADAKSPPSRA